MTETQTTEVKKDPRGWTAVAAATALAVVFAALVVFPGFVAAGLSKEEVVFVELFPGDEWSVTQWNPGASGSSGKAEATKVILYPAYQLMRCSSMAREFYEWQFHRAGGMAMEFNG